MDTRSTVRLQSPAVVLAVLCGALVLVMASMSTVPTALPDIGRSTGATQAELAWIVDSYTVVFAALLLPCGALGDKYGRRRMLLLGLTVFVIASLAGLAWDTPTGLIATRGLTGVGAALVMPATLSLITSTMRDGAQDRAVALWAASATVGALSGSLVAGSVLEVAGWRSIFAVTGVAGVVVLIAALVLPESAEPGRPRLDLPGTVTSATGIGLLVFGILQAAVHGWGSAHVWTGLTTGGALLLAFVAIETRREHPLLDPRVFRMVPLRTGTWVLATAWAALFGYMFLTVQYLQLVEGKSALGAAVGILPIAISLLPLSLLAPALATRFGLRVATVLGLLPMGIGFLLMAELSPGEDSRFLAAMLLQGAAMGLCVPPATAAILRCLPSGQQGLASALNDAAREIGAAVGLAVAGSALAVGYANNLGPAVGALPEPAREQAQASLAGALEAGAAVGPEAAPALTEAQGAFLAGVHSAATAFFVLTVVLIVAAILFAPGRRRPDAR